MSIIDKFKKEKEQTGKKSIAKEADSKVKAEAKKLEKTEEKVADTQKKVETKKKTAKKTSEKEAPKKAVTSVSKEALQTLIRPIVSEKTARLSDESVLVFEVAKTANRVQVRNSFRQLYNVTPVNVNIINVRGKRVRFGRLAGKRNDYKKALITLPKGTRVDIFEGV